MEDFCVKLADFGCSKMSSNSVSLRKDVGTASFLAPEVFGESGHGRKADIWSLGCVLVEMATAEDPWGKGKIQNVMQAVNVIGLSGRTPPIPASLPQAGQ